MSIHKLLPEHFESFTLSTNPKFQYVSNSGGTTGSVYVYRERSTIEKNPTGNLAFDSTTVDTANIDSALAFARSTGQIGSYLSAINGASVHQAKQQKLEIIRFSPGATYNKDAARKALITDLLMPYYRTTNSSYNYSYTNYHCLNFFTASSVPSNSVLLYPQVTAAVNGRMSGSYVPKDAFTIDFWINPKYSTLVSTDNYKPGTILHMSSTYAVSLVSGSSKDGNGLPNAFRVMVQLTSSADIAPSTVDVNSLPNFVYLSSDNSLLKNTWNHVTIRWGSSTYNSGTGSILINNIEQTVFNIPSSSIAPYVDPGVLCVGNYYEGTNTGASAQALFFAADVAARDGLLELDPTTGTDYPSAFAFTHPLNAEVHELKLYNKYLSNTEIFSVGSGSVGVNNLLFYLPPFFCKEAPTRSYTASYGGVMRTPFYTKDDTTTTPFNVDLSFEVIGHDINLENFVRDFATGTYPRLLFLTGSALDNSIPIAQTADSILYATGSMRKRALTILPCDNGKCWPDFDRLNTLDTGSFVTDLGGKEIGSITLRNLYDTSSVYNYMGDDTSTNLVKALSGPDPTDTTTITQPTGVVPIVLQRTRDNSSNQIVVFDISNLFYGNSIKPGSISISSTLSGSDGRVLISLRDDKNGNIYRANCTGSYATWNSVGNVFYNEGLVLLKSPHLYFFGNEEFSVELKGEQNLHTLRINCTAFPSMETSSSNPTYCYPSASLNANDTDSKYVYITDVYIHDDNLNVIGRQKITQPIMKRTADKIQFRYRMDF